MCGAWPISRSAKWMDRSNQDLRPPLHLSQVSLPVPDGNCTPLGVLYRSCYVGDIMAEIPGDLKPDLQRTLLGPLSLATELFGALIPGSVFLILTCIKLRW
jgi:hypothetical protein